METAGSPENSGRICPSARIVSWISAEPAKHEEDRIVLAWPALQRIGKDHKQANSNRKQRAFQRKPSKPKERLRLLSLRQPAKCEVPSIMIISILLGMRLQTRRPIVVRQKKSQSLPALAVAMIEWTAPLMAADATSSAKPAFIRHRSNQTICKKPIRISSSLPRAVLISTARSGKCVSSPVKTAGAASRLQKGQVYAVDGNAFFNRPGPQTGGIRRNLG